MNRLWVRLSLMISGVLFLMFFLQFLAITLDRSKTAPRMSSSPLKPRPPKSSAVWSNSCSFRWWWEPLVVW